MGGAGTGGGGRAKDMHGRKGAGRECIGAGKGAEGNASTALALAKMNLYGTTAFLGKIS